VAKKVYADAEFYERKLEKVISRFEAVDLEYNFDRHGAWIQFRLDGDLFRFDHTVEKAKAHGVSVNYGSDVFAQLVLALEDLARIAERGIYRITTWLAGMRYLPPPVEVPQCFIALGFQDIPDGEEDVDARYKTLVKVAHPDQGGKKEEFLRIKTAAEQAKQYFQGVV
jgi:hypothetical protein